MVKELNGLGGPFFHIVDGRGHGIDELDRQVVILISSENRIWKMVE
jgi:hypothetical protein